MKSRGIRMRYQLERVLGRVVQRLIVFAPMPAVRAFGRAVGRLAFSLDRSRRRIALDNLAHAFPRRSVAERTAVVRAMSAHFGGLLFELIKFGTYSREQMLAASEIEGAEHARQAHAQGKGVLYFTGHFGYWELFAMAHPLRIEPMSLLVRPLDNPDLHRMLEDLRTATGNSVIYRQGAVRRILRDLAARRGVGILIDQHLHTADAIYVNFFRRPAATTSALAALALRTGAPVVPVFSLPLPNGRYRFIYESPVQPPRADTPDAVREFTQRCTDVLEMYVRRYPDLWLWMHRRWRQAQVASHDAGSQEASSREADV